MILLRKLKIFLLTLVTLYLAFNAIFIKDFSFRKKYTSQEELRIHCIDVGQGDCTLIQNGDITILIDGGEEIYADRIINYLHKQNISSIDVMIATHPHSDHIGSLDRIIDNFKVESIYMNDIAYDSVSYTSLMNTILENKIPLFYPKEKETLTFEHNLTLTFLNCTQDKSYESGVNAYSLVTLLQFKDISYLSGGDLDYEGYDHLLHSSYDLDIDILHAFHHGSSIETNTFLLKEKTTPDFVIISCGYENEYGHPHFETLELFKDAEIHRTDLEENIILQIQKDGSILIS